MKLTASKILTLLAFVTFVLAAFGVQPVDGVQMVPLGLAFLAAAVLA